MHRWGEVWRGGGSPPPRQISPHRCNLSPLRGEKPQNWPLSNLNNPQFALRAMLPVTTRKGSMGQWVKWVTFWATVCKTVRPMLSDRCLSVCPLLSVCDVRALWPNSWMDEGGRPWSSPHCARWGHSFPPEKRTEPSIFGPSLLWPNGWMHQDATWYGGRPQPRRMK